MKTPLLTLLFFMSACATPKIQDKQIVKLTSIGGKECLRPLEKMARSQKSDVLNSAKQTLGTTASVTLITVGVATDVALWMGSTVVGGALICKSLKDKSSRCVENVQNISNMVAESVSFSGLAYQGTTSWRCPDIDHISRALRKVSSCYQNKGYVVEAYEQLKVLQKDEIFHTCISDREAERVAKQLSEVIAITQI